MEKVDLLLSVIESQQQLDYANLEGNPKFGKLLKKYSKSESEVESLLLSTEVLKMTAGGKSSKRVIAITNAAVYNFSVSQSFRSENRRVPLEQIGFLTLSTTSEDIIFHLTSGISYWIKTPRRSKIVKILFDIYLQVTDRELNIRTVTEDKMNDSASMVLNSSIAEKPRKSPKKKARKKTKGGGIDSEYDIDVSYVTDRIIAMPFPNESEEVSMVQNSYKEVFRFLEEKHHENYLVFNLCSETSYSSSKFRGAIESFLFDESSTPSIDLMDAFCRRADEWLKESSKHVIAVHCKNGQSRTGVMISAYLIYSGICTSADDAMHVFDAQRKSKGVTLPSQKRFLHYFAKYMRDYVKQDKEFSFNGDGHTYILKNVKLRTLPRFNGENCLRVYFTISDANGKHLYDSRDKKTKRAYRIDEGKKQGKVYDVEFEELKFKGMVKFVFYDYDPFKHKTKLLQFWIHTNFFDRSTLLIPKDEIDIASKDFKGKHFSKDFAIVLGFNHTVDDKVLPDTEFALMTPEEILHYIGDLEESAEHFRHLERQMRGMIDELVTENAAYREELGLPEKEGQFREEIEAIDFSMSDNGDTLLTQSLGLSRSSSVSRRHSSASRPQRLTDCVENDLIEDDVVETATGWRRIFSTEQGRHYYWHEGRDITTWQKPSDFE